MVQLSECSPCIIELVWVSCIRNQTVSSQKHTNGMYLTYARIHTQVKRLWRHSHGIRNADTVRKIVAVYVYKKRAATSLIREIEAGENGLPAYTYLRRAQDLFNRKSKQKNEEGRTRNEDTYCKAKQRHKTGAVRCRRWRPPSSAKICEFPKLIGLGVCRFFPLVSFFSHATNDCKRIECTI